MASAPSLGPPPPALNGVPRSGTPLTAPPLALAEDAPLEGRPLLGRGEGAVVVLQGWGGSAGIPQNPRRDPRVGRGDG